MHEDVEIGEEGLHVLAAEGQVAPVARPAARHGAGMVAAAEKPHLAGPVGAIGRAQGVALPGPFERIVAPVPAEHRPGPAVAAPDRRVRAPGRGIDQRRPGVGERRGIARIGGHERAHPFGDRRPVSLVAQEPDEVGAHPGGIVGDVGAGGVARGHLVDHDDEVLVIDGGKPVHHLLEDRRIAHDHRPRAQRLARGENADPGIAGEGAHRVGQRGGHVLVVAPVLQQGGGAPGGPGGAEHVEGGFLGAAEEVEIADHQEVARRAGVAVGPEERRGGKEALFGVGTAAGGFGEAGLAVPEIRRLAVFPADPVIDAQHMGGAGAGQRGGGEPAEGQRAVGQDHAPAERLARPARQPLEAPDQLLVGADARCVPGAAAVEIGAAEQRGAVVEAHQVGKHPRRPQKAQIGRHPHPGRDVGGGLRAREMRHLAGDLLGMRPVVGIVHGHEGAAGLRQRPVARRVAAPVAGLADQPDARIGAGEVRRHLGGGVGAGIVDHQDLEIAVGLVAESGQRGGERGFRLEGRDQHRHPAGRAAGLRARVAPAQIVERQRPGGIALGEGLQAELREDRIDLRQRHGLGLGGVGCAGGGAPARGPDQRGRGIEAARAGQEQGAGLGAAAGAGEEQRREPPPGRIARRMRRDQCGGPGEIAMGGLPAGENQRGRSGLGAGSCRENGEIAPRGLGEPAPEPVLEPGDAAGRAARLQPGPGAGLEAVGQGGAQPGGQGRVEPLEPCGVHDPRHLLVPASCAAPRSGRAGDRCPARAKALSKAGAFHYHHAQSATAASALPCAGPPEARFSEMRSPFR